MTEYKLTVEWSEWTDRPFGCVDAIIDITREQLLAIARGQLRMNELEVTPPPAHLDPSLWTLQRLKSILGYRPYGRSLEGARRAAAEKCCRRRLRYNGAFLDTEEGILRFGADIVFNSDVEYWSTSDSMAAKWTCHHRDAFETLKKRSRAVMTAPFMESHSELDESYFITVNEIDWNAENVHDQIENILPEGVQWDRESCRATWSDMSQARFSYGRLDSVKMHLDYELLEELIADDEFVVAYATMPSKRARELVLERWRQSIKSE
jgi:hypothetical protein